MTHTKISPKASDNGESDEHDKIIKRIAKKREALAECQTDNCSNKADKIGYKLCLDCWINRVIGTGALITSAKIGKHFGVDETWVNIVLSELGWLEKDPMGWNATVLGLYLNAKQRIHHSGSPFVMWPMGILKHEILCEGMAVELGADIPESPVQMQRIIDSWDDAPAPQGKKCTKTSEIPVQSVGRGGTDVRKRFPAKFRATDGHFVRSKAEMLIDNFLYAAGIIHEYERKLPVKEEVYTDFYIPNGKIYIEYWGLEKQPKYAARKQVKLKIYEKYELNLIELGEEEVKDLGNHLPRLLLAFGIEVD